MYWPIIIWKNYHESTLLLTIKIYIRLNKPMDSLMVERVLVNILFTKKSKGYF